MTTSNWYTVEGTSAQQRLTAAWDDAPIENLELCGMLLAVAQSQVIAYAPADAATLAAGGGAPFTATDIAGTIILYRDGGDTVAHVFASGVTGGDLFAYPPEHQPADYVENTSPSGRAVLTGFTGGLVRLTQTTAGAPEYWTFRYPSVNVGAPPVPVNYVYAQLQQAKNLWNAGRANSDGTVGGQFSYTPRPLDKTIQSIIRPTDVRPSVY